MKRMLCRLSAVILALCLLAGCVVAVSAATVPTETYAYWTDVGTSPKPVYGKNLYDVNTVLDAKSMGVENFSEIVSICTDDNDNLYILDDDSRIVVLDANYNLVREIGLIGGTESYSGSKGIYVYGNSIYICHAEGARVIQADLEGNLVDIISLPDSPLIPDDFNFEPIRIIQDKEGYIYVLSEGSYYGAMLYDNDADREFLGFYGANTVSATIGSVFTNIKNRLFPNNDKLANSAKKLPYSFVDLDIDDDGFIYTCTGFTDTANRKGQIKKLSPGKGTNIIDSGSINFVDQRINWVNGKNFEKQDISNIEVDSNGFIYGLEAQYGKVFMYDAECRTLNIFGGGMGEGNQKGTFVTASGLAIQNDGVNVIVSDSNTNLITIFKINDFGVKVKELIALTINGDYDKTKEGWLEVIKEDANFQPAYSGLANAYLDEEDYENAMYYAKIGYDRESYAVAFEYIRKQFISDNFTIIFILLVVVVLGGIALLVISSKKKLTFIKNDSLRLMLTTAIHPSNNFTDIKEKGLGSIPLCFLLLAIYYVTTVLRTLAGGFLFTYYDPTAFNSLIELIRSVGLVVLWVVSNWLVCTLLGGKGKIKEIIIVTCYSLLPLIFENILYIILTNTLLPNEASFLSILSAIAMIYFCFMMIIGMLKIHDFSMGRFLGTTVLSLLGVAAIVFLLILLIILIQQFYGFILTVVTELMTL